MRKILVIWFVCVITVTQAQELNCIVTINVGPDIETTDRMVFRDMKNNLQQFMNGRKWTNDAFRQHEKINCSLRINIEQMPSIGVFSASVQVQAARPVYNTNYTTLTLNFADRDWEFEYIESQPLDYNDNTFSSNLTSMLAFYAYLIIGLDYDSFSELGGNPYFQRALAVVNNAQSASKPGWQPIGSNRNRYWIIENINNPQMVDIRKAMYAYHRLGLDVFDQKPDQSREVILKGLQNIKRVRDINPNAILLVSFLDAKSKEIANIFSEGNIQIRRQAYDLITTIDPSNPTVYEKMIQ